MKQLLLYLICIAFYTSTRGNGVEFLSFTAVQQNETVIVSWMTATENNSNYFCIERSIDAVNFTCVGNVIASGNSISLKLYNYDDNGPFINKQCYIYRLKVIYLDSTFTYSNYIGICYQEIPVITVYNKLYPNPFFDQAIIAFKDITFASEITAYLYDIVGNMVSRYTLPVSGTNLIVWFTIENKNLRSGTYFLVIYNGDERIYSDKLILL